MMGRKSSKDAPTDPGDMEDQTATDNSSSSPVTPVKKASAPKDDLSDIPPPPAAKLKANQDSSRKVSPSKSLLDRYKSRSASSHTSSPPTVKIPTSLPPDDPDSESPKGTKFKHDLDYSTPLANADSADKGKGKARADPASSSSGKSISWKLPKETKSEMKRARISDSTNSAEDEERPEKRPTTRSHSRRSERADSSYKQGRDSINNILAKDMAKDKAKDIANGALYSPPVDKNAGLAIRKAEASKKPSPAPPSPEAGAIKASDQPASKDSVTPEPLPTTPTDRPSTPPQADDSPPIPPKSPRRAAAELAKTEQAKNKKKTPDPNPTITVTPPAKDFPKLPDDSPKSSPVAVRPPIYDATKDANRQWDSELGSNSRPHLPWQHTKRWTCCVCQGMTIVEQTVCSRMSCKHDRCPSKCRLERMDRVKGPYAK